MTQPTIILSPRKPAVSAQGGVLEVLVRVQAAEQPIESQSKVSAKRLALVVDRSGSMSGEPLTEALRCVTHIASCMTPADQLSVVVYDDEANVLLPLSAVKSTDTVRQAVAQVESGGCTDLFAGWEAGYKQLEGGVDSAISRVILLSDGQANRGLCEVSQIEKHCAELLARGVSTTTVGLGRGFNEDLMIAMARSGGGQQYYGQTADDLFDSFDEELQLLQALCLRKIDIKLIPAPGVILEPLGLVQQNPDGSYRLSDLAWGSEAWLMLRLHLSPCATGTKRDLLAVSLQAQTLDATTITEHAPMLSLLVVDESTFASAPVDAGVQDRLQEVEFVLASEALRALVQQGKIREARSMMSDLEKRFGQHAWLSGKLSRLRELAEQDPEMMSKEIRFSSARMASRLAQVDDAPFDSDQTDAPMPAFLRKKLVEGKGRKRAS
jgi:Ca-activated chloride channel homolog